jgi:hypothetical protein
VNASILNSIYIVHIVFYTSPITTVALKVASCIFCSSTDSLTLSDELFHPHDWETANLDTLGNIAKSERVTHRVRATREPS